MNTTPAPPAGRPPRPLLVRAAHAWYAWAGLGLTAAGAYFAANGSSRVGDAAHLRAADPVDWKPVNSQPVGDGSKIILTPAPATDPDDPFRAAPPDKSSADPAPSEADRTEDRSQVEPTEIEAEPRPARAPAVPARPVRRRRCRSRPLSSEGRGGPRRVRQGQGGRPRQERGAGARCRRSCPRRWSCRRSRRGSRSTRRPQGPTLPPAHARPRRRRTPRRPPSPLRPVRRPPGTGRREAPADPAAPAGRAAVPRRHPGLPAAGAGAAEKPGGPGTRSPDRPAQAGRQGRRKGAGGAAREEGAARRPRSGRSSAPCRRKTRSS